MSAFAAVFLQHLYGDSITSHQSLLQAGVGLKNESMVYIVHGKWTIFEEI
ncbi:MAG: hypothetical protein P4L53_12505 [Candidatus Obscuribacterales bacterium]|nr:hypothetical protein [Candidatus Obscuribacterales bacterium]